MVLFTAGLEDYARPICDELDARYGRAFHARLYRPATVACAAYPCLKDLSRLGRDLRRTVLVDDTPLAFLAQPDNGVPIFNFRCARARAWAAAHKHMRAPVLRLAQKNARGEHGSRSARQRPVRPAPQRVQRARSWRTHGPARLLACTCRRAVRRAQPRWPPAPCARH